MPALLPVILLTASHLVLASDVPTLNIAPSCQAVIAASVGHNRDNGACLRRAPGTWQVATAMASVQRRRSGAMPETVPAGRRSKLCRAAELPATRQGSRKYSRRATPAPRARFR